MRPWTSAEKQSGGKGVILLDSNENTVEILGQKSSLPKKFDQVYVQAATQEFVFRNTVAPLVEEALNGFSCTLFAYGQTGTGKTYTMEGGKISDRPEAPHDWYGEKSGMIGRSIMMIFKYLKEHEKRYDFAVKISYLELHNENLNDLLRTPETKGNSRSAPDLASTVKIRTGTNGTNVVEGLQELCVRDPDEIFSELDSAMQRRQVCCTQLNHQSSRSHTIFTIVIQTREIALGSEGIVRTGKLHLVDLAGSENAKRSGADAEAQQEAKNINTSLLTLGRVINALTTGDQHIPYRDSKLTRLLKESLGGKAKTAIIATISPSTINLEETMSTLEYAYRAQSIKNTPQQNTTGSQRHLIDHLSELQQLKSKLAMQARKDGGLWISEEEAQNTQQKMTELECQVETLRVEKAEQAKLLERLQGQHSTAQAELEVLQGTLVQVESQLESTLHESGKLSSLCQQQGEQLESQRQIESQLREESSQLLSSLGTATSHIEALHQRKERSKSIAQQVAETSARTQRNLYQHANLQSELVGCLLGSMEVQVMAVAQETDKTKGGCVEVLSKVQEDIPAGSERLAATLGKLQSSVIRHRDGANGRWDSVRESAQSLGDTRAKTSMQLLEGAQSYKSAIVRQVEKSTDLLEQSQRSVQRFADDIGREVDGYQTAQRGLCDELKQVAEVGLGADFMAMLTTAMQQVERTTAMRLSKIEEDHNKTLEMCRALERRAQCQFIAQTNQLKEMRDEFGLIIKSIADAMDGTTKVLKEKARESDQSTIKFAERTKGAHAKLVASITEKKEAAVQANAHVETTASSLVDKQLVSGLKQLAEVDREFLKEKVAPLMEEAHGTNSRFVEQTISQIKQINEGQLEHEWQLDQQIQRAQDILHTGSQSLAELLKAKQSERTSFEETRLRPNHAALMHEINGMIVQDVDVSTGSTPVKQSYIPAAGRSTPHLVPSCEDKDSDTGSSGEEKTPQKQPIEKSEEIEGGVTVEEQKLPLPVEVTGEIVENVREAEVNKVAAAPSQLRKLTTTSTHSSSSIARKPSISSTASAMNAASRRTTSALPAKDPRKTTTTPSSLLRSYPTKRS